LRAERSNPASDVAACGKCRNWIAASPAAPRNDDGGIAVSFSEKQLFSAWQKLGCAAYFIAAFVICYLALIFVVFDGWDEPPMPRWLSLLLFPGLPMLAVIGGWFLMKFFARDKN
jgi:hypothetical protein